MPVRRIVIAAVAWLLAHGCAPASAAGSPVEPPSSRPWFVGAAVRPVVCLHGCPEYAVAAGLEGGRMPLALGLRAGRDPSSGIVLLLPELRAFWDFPLSSAWTIAPAVEFATPVLFDHGATRLEVAFRAACRLSWRFAGPWVVFVEPLVLDVGVWQQGWYGGRTFGSGAPVVRLGMSTGLQFLFPGGIRSGR